MLISFFKSGEYVTGSDCSYAPEIPETPVVLDEETGEIITPIIPGVPAKGNPDCIAVFDVDFNPYTQTVSLLENKGKYSVKVEDKPLLPETPEEKHSRIYGSIISTESLEGFDIEGEIFSDFEIGQIIMIRVFGGNPHAQMAFIAKIQSMSLSGIPNPELIQKAQEIEVKINAVRNLFNIGNL